MGDCDFFIDFREGGGFVTKDHVGKVNTLLLSTDNTNFVDGGINLDGATEWMDTQKTITDLGLDWDDKWSVYIWLKFATIGAFEVFAGVQRSASPRRRLEFRQASGTTNIMMMQDTSDYLEIATTGTPANNLLRQNIAITNDGLGSSTSIKILHNGIGQPTVDLGVGALNNTIDSGVLNFGIGCRNDDGSPAACTEGIIYTFKKFGVEHDAATVLAIFNEERGGFNV